METRIILSGFGGQGVLLAGQLLAEAAMLENKNVTWMPSYGPEMRGGAANCSVVIADEVIGTPIVQEPDILVVMNIPSLEQFEKRVLANGCLIYNSSLIKDGPTRTDINIIPLPCNEIANNLGVAKTINMPILGAIIELSGIVKLESLEQAMMKKFGESKKQLIVLNMEAIALGRKTIEELEKKND